LARECVRIGAERPWRDFKLDFAHDLKRYEFGHLPLEAHVLQTRESGGQTFHVVKIHFPRGDAASFLMGFNPEGKITGVTLMSMAGD
jgi:hypothetical protein